MMVLPAAPEDVAFRGNRNLDARMGAQQQMEALEILKEAFKDRLALASPVQRRPAETAEGGPALLHGSPQIYVHSKLSLFGLREGILSSANLNGRSLRWDTEAGLHLKNPKHITLLWSKVLCAWLGSTAPDPSGDPIDFIASVNRLLAANMVLAPENRIHHLLPFARGKDVALAQTVHGVPDELV